MTVTPKPFAFGKLKGAVYDFPNIGDILPSHIHTPETAHITIVARGTIRVTAGDWTQDVSCGGVIDLPASRIVNIVK